MADDATLPLPDPELTARVLEALENGTPAEVGALRRVVPADDTELRAALAAVQGYRAHLQAERQRPRAAAASADGELEPGTRISDFVIEGRIGAGAMGVVYRARQVSLGDRTVALKVLPRALLARDRRFADRFRREASLAATIHHPNLAEVYGFEESEDTLCFAMRLVEGRTLHDVLTSLAQQHRGAVRASSPAHVRSCATLARDLAGALAAIHAEGLVHRDVKPSNIVLERAAPNFDEEALTARPVLVDFGLLRPQGDTEITGTRTMLGTPAYASHEIQLGRDIDGRADVFALGAVLHDLLTLTPPGERGPATSGLPAVRTINPTVDLRLAAIVDMALQERRELRYANGGALKEELDRYLRGEPVHALPTGGVGRLRLWARRHPAAAARGTALGVVAVVLVTLLSQFATLASTLAGLATAGAEGEAAGDLIAAAQDYRMLYSRRDDAVLMPWLTDDLAHAAQYSAEGGAIFAAATHLLEGLKALPDDADDPAASASIPFAAEREFAQAGDRLCEILFDPDHAAFHEPVRRFLVREARDGAPEARRRIALDAVSNYQCAQGRGQIVPADMLTVVLDTLAAPGLEPDTRRAAVAALGTMRTPAAFAALLPYIEDEDPECARLARGGAWHQWNWIHHELPDVLAGFDPDLVAGYAEALWNSLEAYAARVDEQYRVRLQRDLSVLEAAHGFFQIAFWCSDPEERSRPRPLQLPDGGMRRRIEEASAELREVYAQNRERITRGPPSDLDLMPLGLYWQVSGRQPYEYQDEIWRPLTTAEMAAEEMTLTPVARANGASEYLVDFFSRQSGAGREPLVHGGIESLSWRGATLRQGPSGLGFLCMQRPGRSRLTIAARVPEKALMLDLFLVHMRAVREPVRDAGEVAFRVRLEGQEFEFSGLAPNSCLDRIGNLPRPFDVEGVKEEEKPEGATWDDEVTLLRIPHLMLAGRDEVTVVLDYVHGNTTYRILQVRFRWYVDER